MQQDKSLPEIFNMLLAFPALESLKIQKVEFEAAKKWWFFTDNS